MKTSKRNRRSRKTGVRGSGLAAARWLEGAIPTCRKCGAESLTDGLCVKHYFQMLDQFETRSSKAKLKVGAAPSNEKAQ